MAKLTEVPRARCWPIGCVPPASTGRRAPPAATATRGCRGADLPRPGHPGHAAGWPRLHLANRLGEPFDPKAFAARDHALAMAWTCGVRPMCNGPPTWPGGPTPSGPSAKRRSTGVGSGVVKQIRGVRAVTVDAYDITAERWPRS